MATGAQGGCRTLELRIRLPSGVVNTLTESRCGRGARIQQRAEPPGAVTLRPKGSAQNLGMSRLTETASPSADCRRKAVAVPKKTPRIRCRTFLVRTSESQVGRAAALGFAGTLAPCSSHDEWPLSISDSARSDRGARPRLRLLGRQLCAVGGRSG